MTPPRRKNPVHVNAPRIEERDGASFVSALVDGMEVWIASDDLPLRAAPEAFPSAFLIPAIARRAELRVNGPVDEVWRVNMVEAARTLHRWFGYAALPPAIMEGRNGRPVERVPFRRRSIGIEPAPRPARATHGETVLYFSGGTDSFHTLLCGNERIDRLVLLAGFDYALDDHRRHAAAERTLREVAQARGARASVVRTNLRDHPLFRDIAWERTHGGVLGAIGLAMGDPVSHVVISSSISYEYGHPWGSHWQLDPLWGSSTRTCVAVGQQFRKWEKLRQIANDPLVQRHLRVCWVNAAPEGNCHRCYKCLYARLVLHELGVLDAFETLDGVATLAADHDALPRAKQRLRLYRELVHSPNLDPEVQRAVRGLMQRTRRLNSWPVRTRRALVKRVTGLLPRRAESSR